MGFMKTVKTEKGYSFDSTSDRVSVSGDTTWVHATDPDTGVESCVARFDSVELSDALNDALDGEELEKYGRAAEAIVDHIDGDSNDYKAVMAILREWL